MKCILYSTKRRISLTLEGTSSPNWNYAMHSPDFRAYKNAFTDIEFIVRNIDRKPIKNLNDYEIFCTISDHETKEVYATIPIDVIEPDRGLIKMTITPQQIQNWPIGYLSYVVSIKDNDDKVKLLYTDQYDQARGFFEISDGAFPEPRPTIYVNPDDFNTMSNDDEWFFNVSGSFPGNQQNLSSGTTHTIVFYANNFSGKFWIDGSIEDSQSPSIEDWFNIPQGPNGYYAFDNFTGSLMFDVNINLYWLRFRYKKNEDNHDGEFIKISYRN